MKGTRYGRSGRQSRRRMDPRGRRAAALAGRRSGQVQAASALGRLTAMTSAWSCLLLVPAVWWASAMGDEDQLRARQLRDQGAILPLERIVAKAEAHHPGRVLDVELETEHGRPIYELQILDDRGVVSELRLDAATGELLGRASGR
jgi:hypothetical protein